MTVSFGNWQAHALERGTVVVDDAASRAALVRGQDYISFEYLNRVSKTVPDDISDMAVYEAASFEVETPGIWSKVFTSAEKTLVKVGEIQWSPSTSTGGNGGETPKSTKIEGMFRPYMMRYVGAYAV